VENPILASSEMYRVLETGGYCFVYVPFLYYYHASEGYYGDYWRFTKDALGMLFDDFSTVEICSVRDRVETWINLSPFGRHAFLKMTGRFLDGVFRKESKQVSGYYAFIKK